MNRYETFIIFEADLAQEERKAILDRAESLIAGDNGLVLIFDDWGSRKLSYPIRKKNQGYYIRADYCSTGKAVEAIERIFTQDTRVLRFMTIRLEADVDPEALKAEITEATQQQETGQEEIAPAGTEAPDAPGEEAGVEAETESETKAEAEAETEAEAEAETQRPDPDKE